MVDCHNGNVSVVLSICLLSVSKAKSDESIGAAHAISLPSSLHMYTQSLIKYLARNKYSYSLEKLISAETVHKFPL